MSALRALAARVRTQAQRPGSAAPLRRLSGQQSNYLSELKVGKEEAIKPRFIADASEVAASARHQTSAFNVHNSTPRRATLVLEDGTRLTGQTRR